MTTIKIHDLETGEITEREMTPKELEQMEKDHASSLAYLAAIAAQKAQREALLERLGITEDEAKLLLS